MKGTDAPYFYKEITEKLAIGDSTLRKFVPSVRRTEL